MFNFGQDLTDDRINLFLNSRRKDNAESVYIFRFNAENNGLRNMIKRLA